MPTAIEFVRAQATAEHLDRMARMIGAMQQLADDLRRGDRMAGNRLAVAKGSIKPKNCSMLTQLFSRMMFASQLLSPKMDSARLEPN